jgi:hypothetical protein
MALIGGAAAVVLVAGSTASAGQIMQTESFGPTTPDFSGTLTFDKFDDQGGTLTLTGIKVKVQLDIDGGSAFADNDGVEPGTVDVEFGATGAISSTDVSLLDGAFQPVTADVDVLNLATFNLTGHQGADPIGTPEFEGDGDDDQIIGGPGSDMSMGFINSLFYAEYIGLDTFEIDFDVTTAFSISGASGVGGGFAPVIASGNVMITYDFIPAPGVASLLGVAGLAAARRRR